ncbi:DUF805 domain-containing protein [uncultured Paraglaciecola sp.]|uniref:DUF805 domain-containing protein n=1 Tax=uncultured Paraglaciecola sp. TaxID=1765024 RepID=UPI002610F2CC|nr:DUF805 domain-containing protein [uncultured Paraglaciecola sp.]
MNWYMEALKKYAQFGGRSRRKEYWLFVLFNMIFSIALTFIDAFIGTLNLELGLGLLSSTYGLAVFIPSIAVGFRRLHDTGRSAWWFLLFLIPLIGWLVILFYLVQDSQEEENQYGVSPKLAA